ncbi:unnamed protein product [Cuscuta campestris]|uniref:RING-type domain-containing protein n=1 Tax=Cuscuta campestris TaxID=132261 RepID=A0A484N1G1_9ASTE|nr:unnamed protein product [Cuscuta campestris]
MSEHEISSLKRGPFARAVEELCSICLDEFRCGSLVVITLPPPCDQVFYSRCIARWLHRNRTCPVLPFLRLEFGNSLKLEILIFLLWEWIAAAVAPVTATKVASRD